MVSTLCLTPSCLGSTKIFCVQNSECLGINIENHTNRRHLRVNYVFQAPPQDNKYCLITTKASNGNQPNTKPNSVICADCDGNGAVLCSQCKGSGVNSVDIFNGQFKAGASCWLCGGRKEMLCGNCNGAGFCGGFLSTGDQ
ncbi:hypothetical protein TSUD_306170 [Trifolium subterraneum]|uniref:BSD2 cysteine rich domain-containing protein n=1 Tax=Trifolium subterraneum TaxID=3900 RepID=A0A2Z6MVZ5_TRISU|nr:hypothetical protein TSUD_306170 [Trifolium subterraneum]